MWGEEVSSHLPVVVYSNEPGFRSFGTMARDMWRDLKASRELAWRLMVRDISAQYRQSLFGIFWAFVPPLATALIFIFLNSHKVINIEETAIPYPVFAIVGTFLWQIFVFGFNSPIRVVTASKSMLTKINFPREALLLSSLGQTLFDTGIKAVILIVVLLTFKIQFTWGALFALIALIILLLLGMTFGLLLTPIGLLYTDVSHGLTIMITMWFFLTPVVYPPPTNFPLSLIATLNPVSPILVGARDLATTGVLHNPIMCFLVTFMMLLLLMVAWIIYRLAMPIVIERISE
jgi:lipopolysaccharide transport system permease protein